MLLLFSPNHTKILTVSSSFAYIDNIFLLKCMSSKKEIEEFSSSSFPFLYSLSFKK